VPQEMICATPSAGINRASLIVVACSRLPATQGTR